MRQAKKIKDVISVKGQWLVLLLSILNISIVVFVYNVLVSEEIEKFQKNIESSCYFSKVKISEQFVSTEASLRALECFFNKEKADFKPGAADTMMANSPFAHVLEWSCLENDTLSLKYSFPSQKKVAELGTDFYADEKLKDILDEARKGGYSRAGHPFFVKDFSVLAFRLFVPLYTHDSIRKRKFLGFGSGVFFYRDIIQESLRLFNERIYDLWVFDVTEEDVLVYMNQFTKNDLPAKYKKRGNISSSELKTFYDEYHKYSYHFMFFGRKMEVVFVFDRTFLAFSFKKRAVVLSFIIAMMGFLFAFFIWQQIRRNSIIAKEVEIQTSKLNKVNSVLHASQSQFQSLVNNIQAIPYRGYFDKERTMIYINDYLETITGYLPEDVIDNRNISYSQLIMLDDREEVFNKIFEAVKNNSGWECEYRIIGRDSKVKWVYEKGQAVLDKDGSVQFLDGFIFDITGRKEAEKNKAELEAQLAQAQKVESIGILAAGIAHEINTPVQYVNDYVTFVGKAVNDLFMVLNEYRKIIEIKLPQETEALSRMEEEIDMEFLKEEMPEAIVNSQEGLERITTIVRAMRDFSHVGIEDAKVIADINKAIESTITISKNEWKYVAEIEKNFDPEVDSVACYVGDLKQVILNLIINAAHAIKEKVGDQPLEKGIIKISTKREDGFVVISVADTGAGISEKNKDKVFDQFFTTKDVGKGTGQGLAMAYSIVVQKHGGKIEFETEEGVGTEFFIKIPEQTYDTDGGE